MYPIIVRADALAAGMSPGAIDRMLRRGRWRQLHQSVYVESGTELTPPLRAAAALQAAGPDAVVSHHTAARLHGIEIVSAAKAAVAPEHVTVTPCRRRRSRRTLAVHARDLTATDRFVIGDIPVTGAARTVRDLLLDADRLTAIWAAENALRHRLVDRAELVAHLEGAIGTCGVRAARQRYALIEPPSESPLETGVRLLAHDAGLPPFEVQIPVLDGRYRIDLGYRRLRLGIECDGRSHDEVRALYSDRLRANALDAAGWRLLRFTWPDLMSRPQYIVDTIVRALRRAA